MSYVMGDPKTVLEGSVKYRDKKKWKSRWAVVSKLSPVADCLHIQLYRDSKERCKNGPTKASLSLEEFLGMETGFTLDKESNTMALICAELIVVLAFDSRELLIQWQVKIRANLVEEQQFLVQIAHIPPKSKLPCGPARLHLQDHTFCLVSGVPPRLLGTWPIKELRRFGVIEGKFCFEGGSLCGKGEGLHVLLTNQSEELSQSMDLASKGKLMGKRKALTRKASMLETSTRYPMRKRCNIDSKGSTTDSSCRPLISSGSEGSTCDACSEILRHTDNGDDMYNSSIASMKASSCRIHYRWPSCLSRWGQSSTTTTSDVDSVDTVSVILSDCQGSSHSATMSKSTHGQSLSCLCDTQGTWPFNQCTKCGRQFYGRHSFQSCKGRPSSPEQISNEDNNGFSPQWTMDSLLGPSTYGETKKDSTYQMMNPPSDRASLCSHASQSSSASAASSSGSEYSVPKNFLETLYDKPKHVQHALNGISNGTLPDSKRTNGTMEKSNGNQVPKENCMLCSCHEPMKDWIMSSASNQQDAVYGQKDCACWNKFSMPIKNEVDIRMINGRKSASANASPSSSPKKSKYNTGGANTLRPSTNNDLLDSEPLCTCGKNDPYANYAIPKATGLQSMMTIPSSSTGSDKVAKGQIQVGPTEEYDVPKKFMDLLPNCDMTQKASAMKSVNNGSSCSCMNTCKMVQNIELFKMASKHSYPHKPGNSSALDALQMCACQRVMLWAGSLVPCLGPQRQPIDTGWQYASSSAFDGKNCMINGHPVAICTTPPKTAEVIMKNGKLKHLVRESTMDSCLENNRSQTSQCMHRPRSNTVSYPLQQNCDFSKLNYANIDLSSSSIDQLHKVTDDSTALNYANMEFAETLSLYENSNTVLSRLEGEKKPEAICHDKPPLPPRSHLSKIKVREVTQESDEKCKYTMFSQQKSPKKLDIQTNGSAYEMMYYQKDLSNDQGDEDYLMMQPLCIKESKTSASTTDIVKQEADIDCPENTEEIKTAEIKGEFQSVLPLRPFMPYSYPISEGISAISLEDSSDMMLRRHQLMNEDLLRSMRSNSFSELKKKVLMRKRSCSVDGKNKSNQGKDSGVESVPASPVCSPRPTVQRKNSLFSKLNLRSKEKSMSTNEIALPLPTPNGMSSISITANKSSLHRSADCLKLNEDYANSDDELNSDNSDLAQKELSSVTTMKRSASVPCRAALPTVTPSSPIQTDETIMELNDLNKDSILERVSEDVCDSKDISQRKYSLDSHERSKQRTLNGVRSNCDNMYRQEHLDEHDTVMEMQGIMRRNHVHSERNGSATSSCSSSDISDYMESLSFISRSSSSSSGSTGSADYMRSEDLYNTRTIPRPPPKSNLLSINNSAIPIVHQSRHSNEMNCVDITSQTTNHRNQFYPEESSSGTSSSCSYQNPKCCLPKNDSNVLGNSSKCNRDSRSSTSSTSSLSTSPSVTDYSSSTSSSSPPSSSNLIPKQHIKPNSSLETKQEPKKHQRSIFGHSSSESKKKS